MKKILSIILALLAFAVPTIASAGTVPLGRTTSNVYPYEYTLYPSDSLIIGNTANPQFNGFGSGYARIQTATSSNDIEQWQLINRSTGTSAAGCQFFVNDKATLDTIGAASNYYGGVCLAGSNYNLPGFNGIRANGLGVFATDGPVTIGSGSTNAASSSIYFQAGSGLDASYDMVLQGGTGNLGIGTTTPYARLSVMGQAVVTSIFATSTIATSTLAGPTVIAPARANDCTMFMVGTTTPDPGCAMMVISQIKNTPTQSGGVYQALKFQVSNTTTFAPSLACGQFVWNIAYDTYKGPGRDMGAICARYDQAATSLGGHMAFYVNDHTLGNVMIERMFIDRLGNVGIGSTTSSSQLRQPRLEVSGINSAGNPLFNVNQVASFATTSAFFVDGSSNIGVSTSTMASGGTLVNKFTIVNTGTLNSLFIADSAEPDTTPTVIDANGLGGFGTSTPVGRITITTTSSSTPLLIESITAATGGCIIVKDTGTGGGYTQIYTVGGALLSKVATSISTCN